MLLVVSQRKYNFVPGEFYHLYNRGTDKRIIFEDDFDYKRFQLLLYIANTRDNINVRDICKNENNPYSIPIEQHLVAIRGYCLMPNHYHILITPLIENGLSNFMQKLSTSYSMYFNKKYERTGSLFEGKFKSRIAIDDRYLKYLFSYIHLNPVKLIQPDWKEAGIVDMQKTKDFLENYHYSSFRDEFGEERAESNIINKKPFPVYFKNLEESEREIQDWLNFSLGKT